MSFRAAMSGFVILVLLLGTSSMFVELPSAPVIGPGTSVVPGNYSLMQAFVDAASTGSIYDWPMFNSNPEHTGATSLEVTPPLTKIWSYDVGMSNSFPAVSGGVVYAYGGENDVLTALNASTGTKIWNYSGGGIYSSAAVSGGVVYVGSLDANVYALNASTGAKIWNYMTGSEVPSSPTVSGGVVYVGSDDGNVYALDASTGAKIWSYAIGNSEVSSSPAVSGGVVYIGSDYVASDESNFYALNASTGAKIWGCNTNGSVNASPAVSGGVVYLCLGKIEGEDQSIVTEGGVYALNASTGAKLWNYADDSPEGTSPSISGGTVYVHFLTGDLYAFGKTYMFPINVDSNTYNAQIVSGSIVSAFSFDQSAKKISFNVTGTDGHCNITMPAALIGGPYTTMLDGVSVDPTPNSNATHVSMYFAYASNTHRIEVIGTTVIPEFSTMIVISLTMVILSVAIIYAKKKSDL